MGAKTVAVKALRATGQDDAARRVRLALRPEWLRQKVLDEQIMVPIVLAALAGGKRAIDCGAHKGAVLKDFVNASPDATHIAIEPMPDFAAGLRRDFPTVTVHEVALSDHNGEAQFTIVEGDLGSSSLEAEQAHVSADARTRKIDVKVVELDTLLAGDEGPFGLLKIDVEGTELAALRGARKLLARDHPTVLFEHLATTPGTADLHAFFTDLGYRIYDMLGEGPLSASAFAAANADGRRQNFIALQ